MLHSMNDKMNDVSPIYWVFNENDVNDDACGSCFNLSTVQTKVGHLDGLCHQEMGMVEAVNGWIQRIYCLHWSDDAATQNIFYISVCSFISITIFVVKVLVVHM